MRKRPLSKTASGMTLHNSSPQAIEEVLVGEMQEALGQWKQVVQVKPFLQIDDEDADLSGNVNNAFGAIQLNVYGVNLYIPFIIANKVLLPFDTIRMGEEEVGYDYSKLRRIVNAIEHKAKAQSDGGGTGEFETMEVAKLEDVQPNNGFLGTIMNIRDSHRAKNMHGDAPWMGAGFGVVDDERMLQQASEFDIFDGFHEVMEKIANVKIHSKQEMEQLADQLFKEAEQEENEAFEKTASTKETMEAARVKRDMLQLAEEKLFNVHRAASGNNIAFPTFSEGRFEYRSGRVYRQFESWFTNIKDYTSSKIGAFVIDSKGGYCLLKENEPFMASTREPNYFEMSEELARGMKTGHMYALEKSHAVLYNPFIVDHSYVQDTLNDGIVVSVRERVEGSAPQRTVNTLFSDALSCKEIVTGKTNHNHTGQRTFEIIISKDRDIKEPKFMEMKELRDYITQQAKDPQDARLALEMVLYSDQVFLIPGNTKLLKLEKMIKDYYTRPDGLFKEGPLAKTAAYAGENKATLVVKNDNKPKTYSVKWQFTRNENVNGVKATKIEKRSTENLSKDRAQNMLGKLGFDHRTQAKFFEITDRNGRSATFNLPDAEKASKVASPDAAGEKVKAKLKSIANSMLHSKNFMPMFEDTIANGMATALSELAPSTINAAHKAGDLFDWKEAMETAVEIEKIATKINGPEWHELSALMNLKYRLDKLAHEIACGSYISDGHEVFEKVAEFKPAIEKKASSLIDFNRKQLLHTSSYLVEPQLVKKAIHQLDGLYEYANSSIKKKVQ